ncbi:MAG: hypothetical protein GC137_05670 [Alphaproteobacteria bacterium]|nr:hypothetical protein [Alphaproteobacteria bacterium]
MSLKFKIVELIASKICHDLISPIGAISNGIEIMEELAPDGGDEVNSLIAFSAKQANAKLKTMRMAYGLGGAEQSIRTEDVHKTFGEFIEDEQRLSHDWDPYADLGIEPKRGLPKMLLCCLMFIAECLPKGGTISVEKDSDGITLIKGEGQNAAMRDGFADAINGTTDVDSLEPKCVHSYITFLTASEYNFKITVNESQTNIIYLRLYATAVS